MVKQYPHSILIEWEGKATKNEKGNYVPGAPQQFESVCRAEPNGKGVKIPGADGSLEEFAFLVYIPKTETVIPAGANYTLNGNITGKVKRSHNGQLGSQLWL